MTTEEKEKNWTSLVIGETKTPEIKENTKILNTI
jgi:hypothetical protein